MQYIAYLHKTRKSDYGVSFPDFPGCIAAGRTLEEARRMAGEALALHVEGLLEDSETLPYPSTLDSLVRDSALKDAVAFLVPLDDKAGKAVRINITARQRQIEEIDRRAQAAGLSRSAYIVQAALRPSKRAA
ncbi:MAG: type II toxin-antitoxin system HicB family antitoxin [Enhydrobacter sp.]|nr:type II toxin-antitoxin system HicB family antitoxin [Enhydrobacter sp.]